MVYLPQSAAPQPECNRESIDCQYALGERAADLDWASEWASVIDDDLGLSGSGTAELLDVYAIIGTGRPGGVPPGRYQSKLSRADHPGSFNYRVLLRLKGALSEAELHIVRARLQGGVRNKSARGELCRGLPVDLISGEADGKILLHSDEAVRGIVTAVFERSAASGSARAVRLLGKGPPFPSQSDVIGA